MSKGLEKELEELEIERQAETIIVKNRPESREESWRPKVICCHSNSNETSSANAGVKNLNEVKLIIIIIIIIIIIFLRYRDYEFN